MASSRQSTFDAVVVGAGFAGLYALHSLRDRLGLSVRAFEAGGGLGGTWYFNRYPGARSDSDSYIYCYTFDRKLLQEWEWSERYPEQPEILRYLNHVADRLDLRRDIQLDTRVTGASFDEAAKLWVIRTDRGDSVTARYFISAVGCLSSSNQPAFEGAETFEGRSFHTGHWPHGGVDFTARRVGVIGTGASAVQAIPIIAQQAKRLTVFQRTANYCVPARNGKVDPEKVRSRKADYERIIEAIRNSYFGFEYDFIMKSVLETPAGEREKVFNEMWDTGGFAFWLANYQDMLFTREANDVCAEFLRNRIRETVKDPAVAKMLIPTGYPYGTKRQPLDTNYFETFNRPNVELVDVNETPIAEMTPIGVRTSAKEYEFDIIVFATGFDALTGPLNRIAIRGRNGTLLADRWHDGPHSYLGVAVAGFPNMFTITGPGSPSVLSNMPVSIEQHVEWITGCIDHMRRNGFATVEAQSDAEDRWTAHVAEVANSTLMPTANSWYMGANIPGKPRVFMPYLGGVGPYRQKCNEIAAKGYEGFALAL
jgi:cyclohexanone monooxygenase